eukprot:gene14282-30388_t
MTTVSKKNTEKNSALVRKAHLVIDDSASSVPDEFYKSITENRLFTNGHKAFTVSEQDFLKEAYGREFQAHSNFIEQASRLGRCRDPICDGTPRDENSRLLLSASSVRVVSERYTGSVPRLERFQEHNNKNLITDVKKVQSVRARRDKVEAELRELHESINHKTACIAMAYSCTVPHNLHPALEQTKDRRR